MKQHDGQQGVFERYFMVTLGAAMYTIALIFFVTPHGLYTGGLMGMAQLVRTFIERFSSATIPEGLDLSGIIYYVVNIPLFIMAFREISRPFCIKTLIATTVTTLLLTVIPASSMILQDTLTSCIIGGMIAGAGAGFMLRNGGSGGGLDIVGMVMTKRYKDFSVGKVALVCNLILYVACAALFSIETAIYSIIYSAVSSVTLDRIHYQNIMIKAVIFTKVEGVAEPIMNVLGRGVTEWEGKGAYTGEKEHVLTSVISKYEMAQLRRLVKSVDPNAFISYSRIQSVDGNFIKRL